VVRNPFDEHTASIFRLEKSEAWKIIGYESGRKKMGHGRQE
jgi:hypothetical protein